MADQNAMASDPFSGPPFSGPRLIFTAATLTKWAGYIGRFGLIGAAAMLVKGVFCWTIRSRRW
jgi:hypothetical protein